MNKKTALIALVAITAILLSAKTLEIVRFYDSMDMSKAISGTYCAEPLVRSQQAAPKRGAA